METECYFCINIRKKFCVSVRKFNYYLEEHVSEDKCSRVFLRGSSYSIFHLWDLFVFELENIAIVHNMV